MDTTPIIAIIVPYDVYVELHLGEKRMREVYRCSSIRAAVYWLCLHSVLSPNTGTTYSGCLKANERLAPVGAALSVFVSVLLLSRDAGTKACMAARGETLAIAA